VTVFTGCDLPRAVRRRGERRRRSRSKHLRRWNPAKHGCGVSPPSTPRASPGFRPPAARSSQCHVAALRVRRVPGAGGVPGPCPGVLRL